MRSWGLRLHWQSSSFKWLQLCFFLLDSRWTWPSLKLAWEASEPTKGGSHNIPTWQSWQRKVYSYRSRHWFLAKQAQFWDFLLYLFHLLKTLGLLVQDVSIRTRWCYQCVAGTRCLLHHQHSTGSWDTWWPTRTNVYFLICLNTYVFWVVVLRTMTFSDSWFLMNIKTAYVIRGP